MNATMTQLLSGALEKAKREIRLYDLALAVESDTRQRWGMWRNRRRWVRVTRWTVARLTAPKHIREVEHVFPEDL